LKTLAKLHLKQQGKGGFQLLKTSLLRSHKFKSPTLHDHKFRNKRVNNRFSLFTLEFAALWFVQTTFDLINLTIETEAPLPTYR